MSLSTASPSTRPTLPTSGHGGHGAYADQLLDWLRLYRSGVRKLSLYEHPAIARVEDIVLLAISGRAIPDTLLEKFEPKIRTHVQAIVQARSR